MPAAETTARLLLIPKLEAIYPGVPVRADRMHASLGDKEALCSIYPDRTPIEPKDNFVAEIKLVVQYFGQYDLKVDRYQSVDPTAAEEAAETFRNMLRTNPKTTGVWYFQLNSIVYPPDPTGNITRFEAYLTARTNNTALLETG